MNEPFDPYYTWLGISPKERPLDLYRFLGLPRFESDTVVIESAADQRMAHVRAFQTGPRGELAARILNELAGARVVLLNPQKKAAYDQQLGSTEPAVPRPQTSLALAANSPSALLNPAAPAPAEVSIAKRRRRLLTIGGGGVAAVALLAVGIVYLASGPKPVEEKGKPAQAEAVAANPSPSSTPPAKAAPTVGNADRTQTDSVASTGSPTNESSLAPVDLLSLVNLKSDVRRGRVHSQGSGLMIFAEPHASLNLPYRLPPEYQMDMTVKRTSGNASLTFTLSIAGRPFEFVFDSIPHGVQFTGIGMLDGKNTSQHPLSHRGSVLPTGVLRQLSLVVRSNSVRLIGDGSAIYDWRGDPVRITPADSRPFDFGLLVHNGRFEIQSLKITPLTGAPIEPTALAKSPIPHSQSAGPAPETPADPQTTPSATTAPSVETTASPTRKPSDEAAADSPQDNPAGAGRASDPATPVNPATSGRTASTPLVPASSLDSANAPLASAALAVFKDNCYRCHGRDGSDEGGLNFILQSDELIAKGYIIPGDTSGSRLYKRVAAGTMPPADEQPRPTADQTASLKKWIEAGAPQLIAPPASRAWIANADIVRTIYDDVQRHDSADRQFLRYFTLTHLYNAGLSDDELQSYRLGLSKLINSLSWGAKIVVPQAIDAAQTVLQIDLRDFKWNDKTWDAIIAQNPYSFLAETAQTRDLARLTRTELPFVRADWFVAAASVPPLYHQVLDIPDNSAGLESLLRISVADDIQQLRVARAGFNKSGISQNNRLIERHETYFGAYWRSYDFGHSDGRANLFSHPLGPDAGANSFRADGGEIIFNLPNGLQAYMLVDGAGDRLDKASLAIVSDPRRPDRAVANGLSCISCHIGGIHEKADEVREAVHANLKSFSAAEAEAVAAIYLPQAKMRELQAKDAERFQAALKLTGVLPSRTEPVLMLVQRFEQPLDLTLTSAELGIEPAKLLKQLDTAPQSSRTLAALRVPGGTIQRQVLLDSLDTLASELKLSRARTFAATTPLDTPTRVTNVPDAAKPAARPSVQVEIGGKSDPSSNDLTPAITLKLAAEIPDIIVSKDRRWVYLLNASEGLVERIDTQTQKLDETVVKTVANAERMRLSPNGRTLYVCGSPAGHNSQKESPGEFQIIPAEKFESSGKFTVPFDPWDFAPDDKGHLFATSGGGQAVPIRFVDTNKRAVIADVVNNWTRAAIRLSHDGRTLCADNLNEVRAFSITAVSGKPAQQHLEFVGRIGVLGPFEFTGDNRFLVTTHGPVGRLGASRERNLPIVANLDPATAIAIDPGSKLVFLFTPDRQLRVYAAPDFELKQSFNLGARVRTMAVDTAAGLLYAAVSKELTRDGRNAEDNTVSNLAIYDISGIVSSSGRATPLVVPAPSAATGTGAEAPSSPSHAPVPSVERPSSKSNAGSNDLKRLVTLKLAAAVPDLLLAPDRRWVYFLNASDGEIRRLDTEALKLDDTVVQTGPGAERMRLTPDGKTLYAITAPDGHPRDGNHGTGKIVVVPAQQFQATDRFTIPIDPIDLAPDNEGRIYILPPGQRTSLQLVDARKRAVIAQPTIVWDAKTLNLSHDEKSLVVGNEWGGFILSTAQLLAKKEPAQVNGPAARNFEDRTAHTGRGRLELSPDGKFLAVDTGRVGRVGSADRLPEVAKLGAWDAIAFDSADNRVLVATPDKQLKVFSLPDFELQRAFNVGTRIYEMALDSNGGKLYAAITDKVERRPRGVTAGDLAVFDVSNLTGKLNAPPLEGTGRVHAPTPMETTPQTTANYNQPAELASGGIYKIANMHDGRCLAISAGGRNPGDPALVWKYLDSKEQVWKPVRLPGGGFNLVNLNSGLNLAVRAASKDEKADVIQWNDDAYDDQRWLFEPTQNGFGKIINKNSGLCIGVSGDGQTVKQQQYDGGDAQQWKLIPRESAHRVVDLLALLNLASDKVTGDWKLRDGELVSDFGNASRVEFQYEPPEEYDYEIQFTRTSGQGSVDQVCAVAGRQFLCVLSDWESEFVVGGPNTPINRDFHIVTGRRHTVLAQVRRDRAKAFVDGKLTVEWKADYQGAMLSKPWTLPNSRVLGLGTWQSPTVFHSVKVTEITGQGRLPARQAKADAAPAPAKPKLTDGQWERRWTEKGASLSESLRKQVYTVFQGGTRVKAFSWDLPFVDEQDGDLSIEGTHFFQVFHQTNAGITVREWKNRASYAQGDEPEYVGVFAKLGG